MAIMCGRRALVVHHVCRMRFRSSEGEDRRSAQLVLEPRSVYALTGPARQDWQHHIPPAKTLRYSITFRTMK